MKITGLFVGAVVLVAGVGVARAAHPVIVHEWGTFTSLQDERGEAIGGINVDDEPVPDFVYTAGRHPVTALNHNPRTFGLPPYVPFASKTGILAPVGDPEVTMRLETPVLYIYPPRGQGLATVPPLDVHVDFHGGILSQYYPAATILGAAADASGPVALNQQTMSGLYWSNVRLGSIGTPVKTDDKVWTTPRETSAPLLEVLPKMSDAPFVRHDGLQVEHFLFYRGVGHVDSPVYLDQDPFHVGESGELSICPSWIDRSSSYPTPAGDIALEAQYAGGWLADIHSDGSSAFRAVPPFEEGTRRRIHPFTKVASGFSPADFTRENLAKLKSSMQAALVKEGLYPDEASAMLRTWELSYFKSPGLRFFYIVPRKWVDQVLPLKVTGAPVEITRVMVGRIELVSDEQKAALTRLAKEPYPDLAALKQQALKALAGGKFSPQAQQDFTSGARPLSDLGLDLSPSVRDYLSLGRFRDALIVHEQQQKPSDNLARFIRENGLAAR
jgi:hypothetical protein